MLFPEKLLHYIWRFRYYNSSALCTLQKEEVQIISPGLLNDNAGPDFTEAKIKIGDKLWIGNVELHLKSSDWYKHDHPSDKRYQQIILHVVFENDLPENDPLLQSVPCLELKNHIPKMLLQRYAQLMQQLISIPCAPLIHYADELTWAYWKERLLIERWQQKTAQIQSWLQQNNYNWEETFYWLIARYFGMKVNADAFEELSKSLPLKILVKYKSQALQIEALLFGQAGLLEENLTETYPQQLQKEYRYLAKKHGLHGIAAHRWKWLRMRPANFPSLRIAQFAALVFHSSHLFSRILETKTLDDLMQLLKFNPGKYWETHYRFEQQSAGSVPHPGKNFLHHLTINVICPMLFWYGKEKDEEKYIARSFAWMKELPSENNALLRDWEKINIAAENAADSQALIQLRKYYCDDKLCLQCAVGNKIIRPV